MFIPFRPSVALQSETTSKKISAPTPFETRCQKDKPLLSTTLVNFEFFALFRWRKHGIHTKNIQVQSASTTCFSMSQRLFRLQMAAMGCLLLNLLKADEMFSKKHSVREREKSQVQTCEWFMRSSCSGYTVLTFRKMLKDSNMPFLQRLWNTRGVILKIKLRFFHVLLSLLLK